MSRNAKLRAFAYINLINQSLIRREGRHRLCFLLADNQGYFIKIGYFVYYRMLPDERNSIKAAK